MPSLPTLEYLVSCYGYWAILAGTFFEGETILIIGGFLAHLGYLKLPYVMGAALLGSCLGDQFFFILGRLKGQAILSKFKKTQKRVDKIHKFLYRYNNLIMLGFRFVYGVRILTPIVLGANHDIKTSRFVLFNVMGAFIWSIAVSLGGFFFGKALEIVIKDIKHYQATIVAAMVIIGLLAWFLHRLSGRNR